MTPIFDATQIATLGQDVLAQMSTALVTLAPYAIAVAVGLFVWNRLISFGRGGR
jgi:hypothetical protein